MKNINVLVKKWFDNVNGNTYHSIQFELNNKIIHSGSTYGYSTQYEVTFKEYFSGLTYGYERMYEQTFKEMFKKEYPKRNIKLYNINYNVRNNCLKRQLKELY